MGRADYLQLGDWNVQCYQCGRKRKGSTMKKHWQGYWVCPEHWEPRHPQDFVRNVPDDMTPPWSQPQPAPVFTIPKGTVDSVSIYEQIAWSVTRTRALADSFSVSEDITGVTGALFESYSMSDTVRMDVSQNPQTPVSVAEAMTYQVFNATQLDGFVLNGLAVNSNDLLEISVVLNDSTSLAETNSDSSTLKLGDGTTLTESLTVTTDSVLGDSTLLSESLSYQWTTPSQLNGTVLNGASLNGN